jgi:hypothetical protein
MPRSSRRTHDSAVQRRSAPPAQSLALLFLFRMLPRSVVGALLDLEKLARAVSKEDDGAFSRDTLEKLNGSWRLVFTTGTVDTQKRVGKINYFPIKAVQSFNTQTSPMTLTNGIFAGDFALLQFYGDFEWLEDKRRLEFDFDEIAVLGFRIQLPKGGAAEIGASTGLGAPACSGVVWPSPCTSAPASLPDRREAPGGAAGGRSASRCGLKARMRAQACPCPARRLQGQRAARAVGQEGLLQLDLGRRLDRHRQARPCPPLAPAPARIPKAERARRGEALTCRRVP